MVVIVEGGSRQRKKKKACAQLYRSSFRERFWFVIAKTGVYKFGHRNQLLHENGPNGLHPDPQKLFEVDLILFQFYNFA
jgi:hypothetical protein